MYCKPYLVTTSITMTIIERNSRKNKPMIVPMIQEHYHRYVDEHCHHNIQHPHHDHFIKERYPVLTNRIGADQVESDNKF